MRRVISTLLVEAHGFTPDAAETAAKYIVPTFAAPNVVIAAIKREACLALKLAVGAIDSSSHEKDAVMARQISMALSRHLTGKPYKQIAALHSRDHTTVMYSYSRHLAAMRAANLPADATEADWVAFLVPHALALREATRAERSVVLKKLRASGRTLGCVPARKAA